MNITLSSASRDFNISTNRIGKVVSGDSTKATYMGIWDRIKDFFRSEKKKEALNTLYNLVSLSPSASDSSFARSYSIFQQLKAMADTEQQALFTTTNNGHNIIFSIDSQPVYEYPCDQLNRDDKIFLEIDATNKLNHYEDIKTELTNHLKDRCNVTWKEYREAENPNPIKQLLLDLPRGGYQFGQHTFSYADNVDVQIKNKSLAEFLENTTLEQQLALDTIGTQISAIEAKNIVGKFSKPHALIGNPSSKYAFHLDTTNNDLIVKVTVESHIEPEHFTAYKNAFDAPDAIHPNLNLQTLFSISPRGEFTCIDFHLADSLKQLSTDLLKTESPSLFHFTHFLEKFVKDIELAWPFKVGNNPTLKYDQEAQRTFISEALSQQLDSYSETEKQRALGQLTGEFGYRWRGILEFAAHQVERYVDDPQLSARCNKYAVVMGKLIDILHAQLGQEIPPIIASLLIEDIDQLYPSEVLALSLLDINPSILHTSTIN